MSQSSAFCIIISQFGIMENHKISWKTHGILLPGVCMNPVMKALAALAGLSHQYC